MDTTRMSGQVYREPEEARRHIDEFRQMLLGADCTFGDNEALVDSDGLWTHEAVRSTATLLAHRLTRAGVAGGDLVVIVGERCATFVIVLLGVWMAGARFLVVNRSHLAEASVQALERAKPKLWIILSAEAESAAEIFVRSAGVVATMLPCSREQLSGMLRRHGTAEESRDAEPLHPLGASAAAYAIWTSGTTRQPKLVSTRLNSVANFLSWYRREFGLRASDRFSMLSGLAHDPMIRDVFAPLSLGATLCIPSEGTRLDSAALLGWIASNRITVMHLTPSLIAHLREPRSTSEADTVRLVAFGGQQLTLRHVEKARTLFPNAEIVNFYGATETPQAMGFHRLNRSRHYATECVPIGKGIEGAELLVLGANQQPCAPGERGEIYIRSHFLAEGYLGQPDLTQERFLANPVTGDPSDRVFRSGDIGVMEADGEIRLISRADRQIKIDGNRIELDDIELELAKFPGVRQAAVLFDETREQIIACVAVASPERPDEAQLRRHIAASVAVQAVPAKILALEALPLTVNGKVNYPALLEQARKDAPQPAERMGQVYATLAQIWQTTLGVEQVGSGDSFYDLGGTSILAHHIAGQIQERLGMNVRAADLFIYPTIGELEGFLVSQRGAPCEPDESHDTRSKRRSAIEAARQRQGHSRG